MEQYFFIVGIEDSMHDSVQKQIANAMGIICHHSALGLTSECM